MSSTHADSRNTPSSEADTRDISGLYQVFSNHLDRARGIVGLMRRGLNEDDGENAAAAAYEHIEAAEKLAEHIYRLGIQRDVAGDRRETAAGASSTSEARPSIVGVSRHVKGGKANGGEPPESNA